MRRFRPCPRSLAFAAGVSLALLPQPSSAVSPFGGATHSDNCDDLAASPTDLGRPRGMKGVYADEIDLESALYSCGFAARQAPWNTRMRYQYGRVLYRAGYREQGVAETRVAALQDYIVAKTALGGMLLGGTEDRPPDHKSALSWFEAAAEDGDAQGTRFAARMLDAGQGVPTPAPERAAIYWKRLAEYGDAEAKAKLHVAGNEPKPAPPAKAAPRVAVNAPPPVAKAPPATRSAPQAKSDGSWFGWGAAGLAAGCLYFETCRSFAGDVIYDYLKKEGVDALSGRKRG